MSKFGAAGWGDSPRTMVSKRGTPLRNRYLTTISPSSIKTVADRHRLSAYHNKHWWRPFRWYQHLWPWTPKIGGFSEFFAVSGCDTHSDWILAEITGDKPRQPSYRIKLMLSCVSWALAQISCNYHCLHSYHNTQNMKKIITAKQNKFKMLSNLAIAGLIIETVSATASVVYL